MGDLICRQAAIIALNKRAENVSLKTRIGLLDAVRVIDELPSVEPKRKSGIWTHEDAGVWICEVCGEEVGEMGNEYGVPKYNFCPYCGADMTGRR